MPVSQRPWITIGMPVYNGADFIETALSAIVEQTYRNFTLLVSDNVSTDGTWEILQDRAARDDRIVLHRQDTNIGASRNFRYVLDQAETEYFMWHAHDDWRAPNYLEELVKVIVAEPGCALACPSIQRITEDGSPKRLRPPPVLTEDMPLSRRVLLSLRQSEVYWFYGLFRTETLRQAYRFAEEFGYLWCGDRIMLLPFILNDEIRGTAKTTLYSRRTLLSRDRYCPKTPLEQFRFLRSYLRWHFRLLGDCKLSRRERLVCWPWVLKRCLGTTSFGYHRRLIKVPVKRLKATLVGPGNELGNGS